MLGEKRYHEAEILFLLAAQRQPDFKYYHNNLAVAYMNQGKYHKAYSRLQIAIALDEAYIRALSNMAVTCFHLLKFREAYSYYHKVSSLDTAYVQNRFDRNRVIEKIESLKRENPHNKDLYYILRHLRTQQDVSP
jgi:tetratricopeptide (TPR) repeat protein